MNRASAFAFTLFCACSSGETSQAVGSAVASSASSSAASSTASASSTGAGGGGPSCTLADSPPIVVSTDGQVVEHVRVTSTNGAAISVDGHSNVVIRDVEILHAGGPGIAFSNAPGITIERAHVVHTGAPAAGPNDSEALVDISGYGSTGVSIDHAKLERGSSGVYLVECPGAKVTFIEGHDFRGPFPRGQVVQFDKSDGSTLEDFSCENPPDTSFPEDNVSVFQSSDVTVRRGLLSGNNSPSGVGVMFEQSDGSTSGGLCEDVDTIDQGNGSFSGYPARNVVFRRTRARDNHCQGQAGRDAPLSNSLVWSGSPDSMGLEIRDSHYFNLCNLGNIVWDETVFVAVEVAADDFTPRAPLRLTFCWE